MLRIAINGFGRIGRVVARMILQSEDCELVCINELDPEVNNLAYLLKYDSLYGRFSGVIEVNSNEKSILCNGKQIRVYSYSKIENVPWESHNIDVVIEATGVKANVLAARKLLKCGVSKVVVTHSPPIEDVDAIIVLGVNECSYAADKHHIISSSICDAIAIAPVLFEINNTWGVENCFITTLHPWLSYQNLLDGPVSSISSPGHFWNDYALGRNSTLNLILKDTTASSAVLKVLPELKGRVDAISFRVPTNIVSASDLTIALKREVKIEEINTHFEKISKTKSRVIELERESLVSMDYLGTQKSVIIDAKATKVLNGRMVKMVIWYDNEWGYGSRVLDIARLVGSKSKKTL